MNSRILFLYSLLFICVSAGAQPWMEKARQKKPNPNFYDIQKEFNHYWKTKNRWKFFSKEREEEERPGWEQFKRWEYFMEPRVFPTGNFPSGDHLYKEILKKENAKKSQLPGIASANWSLMGPVNAVPQNGGVGRVNCIEFDPITSSTIWVGSPAGGLWKSTNNGGSWSTNTDQLAVLGVTDVAIDPQNTSIMYIATGDGEGNADTKSIGVMKSTDGGLTWNNTGLNWNILLGRKIHKLIINPVHTDTLIAATSFALFITPDGGANWTQLNAGDFSDVEFKPGNPDSVYAVDDSKFFISTDGGFSWNNPPLNGFPGLGMNRMMIAVTPDNPNAVYMVASNASDNGFMGVYKSSDAGNSWVTKATTPNLLGWNANGNDSGGQGWYDLAFAVSPVDENSMYVGGVNIWKSTNGGSSWSIKAHWTGAGGVPYVHADQHALEYQVVNGNGAVLFAGNDGGVFKKDPGNSWSDKSAGLQIQQYYKLSSSQTDPTLVIMGAQDNGTNLYSAGNMSEVIGGDGMECIIDNTNAVNMYGELYYGDIRKSTDGGNNFVGIAPDNNGGWVTPFVLDPNNNQVLYAGYKDIYKSTDEGWSWTKIAPNLASGQQFVGMAIAPSDSKTVYAVSNNFAFKTINGGISWTNITSNLPVQTVAISYVTVSNTDPKKAWITFSGYFGSEKIYRTTDGGISWSNVTLSGLPNVPANCVVSEDNSPFDALYVGTDLGVYYYNNTMNSWQSYNNGLPNVIVNELDIQYTAGKLRAATYGRGLWESDLYTVALLNEDAAVINATYPLAENMCDTMFAPVVRLKNNGINNLVSDTIVYTVDGVPHKYYWTGNLFTGAYADVTLPLVYVSTGPHTFTSSSSFPNNLADANPNNDGISIINFTVSLVNTFTYLANFNTSPAYWQHSASGSNATDIWNWGVPTGPLLNTAHTGTRVYGTNLSGNYVRDNKCYLETPCYDFSALVKPRMEFYMAYDMELNGDALYVEYTTDNGANWQKLGTANDIGWYNSNVNNGPICNGAQWTGSNTAWQLYGHDLTLLAGQQFVKFRFQLNTDSGGEKEGIVLDDFTIFENTLGIQEEKNVLFNVYPNPATGKVFIDLDKLGVQEVQLRVLNTMGQPVLSRSEQLSDSKRLELDLRDQPEGIYFITLQSKGGVVTRKLVLNR